MTPLEAIFAPRILSGPEGTACPCDLSSGVSKFLMSTALDTSNIETWREGLIALNVIPKCQGIAGVTEETVSQESETFGSFATWYHVAGHPGIEACPSCFLCIIAPLGAEHLFTPITRPLTAGMVRTCHFWIGQGGVASFDPDEFQTTLQWRGFMLRHVLSIWYESKMQKARDGEGDIELFSKVARALDECGPPCAGNARGFRKVNGRRWFGRVSRSGGVGKADENDCTVVICEECYNYLVKDTALQPELGADLTELVYSSSPDKEAFCGPFSKVSKAVLRDAAAKADFSLFARHWNHRAQVRDRTVPLIQAYRAQFNMQNMRKAHAYVNATAVQAGASVSEAAGSDGYKYGNSVVSFTLFFTRQLPHFSPLFVPHIPPSSCSRPKSDG
jgi:hypothetical protein